MIRRILRLVRFLIIWLFDYYAIKTNHPSARNLLLVRVDNIGDFILWLPSARRILENYPNCRSTVLICNQTCVDFAEATRLFSQVIGVDLRRFIRDLAYRWRVIRQVTQLGAEIAIQPTYSRVFLTGDSLIRASRAEQRIGSQGDLSNIYPMQKIISDRWYTWLIPASAKQLMELERNEEFLRGVGVRNVQAEIPLIPKLVQLPPEKRVGNDYFVLFPGASSPTKKWPLEFFSAVADHLSDQFGWTLVVCGGPAERLLGDQVLEKASVLNGINFAGRTTLPELTELLRGARVVISNDTSAVHIAAGVCTPSVCVLGGGHYGRFLPYPIHVDGVRPVSVIHKMDCFGCNWRCIWTDDASAPYPCVSGVQVNQVIAGVESALAATA